MLETNETNVKFKYIIYYYGTTCSEGSADFITAILKKQILGNQTFHSSLQYSQTLRLSILMISYS